MVFLHTSTHNHTQAHTQIYTQTHTHTPSKYDRRSYKAPLRTFQCHPPRHPDRNTHTHALLSMRTTRPKLISRLYERTPCDTMDCCAGHVAQALYSMPLPQKVTLAIFFRSISRTGFCLTSTHAFSFVYILSKTAKIYFLKITKLSSNNELTYTYSFKML